MLFKFLLRTLKKKVSYGFNDIAFFLLLILISASSYAQDEQGVSFRTEIFTDNNTENINNYDLLERYRYQKQNVNQLNAKDLHVFSFLTPFQKQSFLHYQKENGQLIDLNELQNIPYWNDTTCTLFKQYVQIEKGLSEEQKTNHHFLFIQSTVYANPPKAFSLTDSNNNTYKGKAFDAFIKYHFSNRQIDFGGVAKQQAGESFNSTGFDFYSAYVSFTPQRLRYLKKVILGDFNLQLGQGLIAWQQFGFNKSTDVLRIEKDQPVFQLKRSITEANFKRGIATEWQLGSGSCYLFFSARDIDAYLNTNNEVTSFIKTGYHRNENEMNNKNNVLEYSYGGRIAYNFSPLELGFSVVNYNYSTKITATDFTHPNAHFPFQSLSSASIDYKLPFRSYLFFGELAINSNKQIGTVHGVVKAMNAYLDIGILVRHFDVFYQSIYGNAFREKSTMNNENGCYLTAVFKPNKKHEFSWFTDLAVSPWFNYNAYSDTKTTEHFIRYATTIQSIFTLQINYAYKNKNVLRYQNNETIMKLVTQDITQHFRGLLKMQCSPDVSLHTQAEYRLYDNNLSQQTNGFSLYQDITCKHIFSLPLSVNMRLQYFEIANDDVAIYTYERDVLHDFNFNYANGKGFRYYLNLHYNFNKKYYFSLRWSHSIYDNVDQIGGDTYNQIEGNKKGILKAQFFLNL